MPLTIARRPDRGRSSECLRRRFHSGARSMCQVHLAHTSVSFARNSELHRRRAMMRLYSIMSNLGQDPTKHDIERVVESWFSNQKWQFDGNSAAWQFTDGHLPSFGFGPRVAIRKYSRAKSGGNSSHKTITIKPHFSVSATSKSSMLPLGSMELSRVAIVNAAGARMVQCQPGAGAWPGRACVERIEYPLSGRSGGYVAALRPLPRIGIATSM
jgi:hypothetical protein